MGRGVQRAGHHTLDTPGGRVPVKRLPPAAPHLPLGRMRIFLALLFLVGSCWPLARETRGPAEWSPPPGPSEDTVSSARPIPANSRTGRRCGSRDRRPALRATGLARRPDDSTQHDEAD